MTYRIQNKATKKWYGGFLAGSPECPVNWVDDRKDAKKLKRTDIQALWQDAVCRASIGDCSAERAEVADVRAIDGIVSNGWRLVRKGGRIKFAGDTYEHPTLAPLVGKKVEVYAEDYWIQTPEVYYPKRDLSVPGQNQLCNATAVK